MINDGHFNKPFILESHQGAHVRIGFLPTYCICIHDATVRLLYKRFTLTYWPGELLLTSKCLLAVKNIVIIEQFLQLLNIIWRHSKFFAFIEHYSESLNLFPGKIISLYSLFIWRLFVVIHYWRAFGGVFLELKSLWRYWRFFECIEDSLELLKIISIYCILFADIQDSLHPLKILWWYWRFLVCI